jgi:hypothetical protein
MIRRDGVLPDDAPPFGAYLDDDLLGYGYALISTGLQLLDATDVEGGDEERDGLAERLQLAQNGPDRACSPLSSRSSRCLTTSKLLAGISCDSSIRCALPVALVPKAPTSDDNGTGATVTE